MEAKSKHLYWCPYCRFSNSFDYPVATDAIIMCLQCKKSFPSNLINAHTYESNEEPEGLQTFSSGATSSKQLPSYNLIAICMLDRLAARMDLGAVKHGKFQYRKGLKDKAFILDRLNHAIKHIRLAQDLIENDEVYTDDDLGGAAANIMMAMEYQEANDLLPE